MSNSLAAVHPELIAEWSEKNLPLTPDSITFGSNKKVWWKGACGHEWTAVLSSAALISFLYPAQYSHDTFLLHTAFLTERNPLSKKDSGTHL